MPIESVIRRTGFEIATKKSLSPAQNAFFSVPPRFPEAADPLGNRCQTVPEPGFGMPDPTAWFAGFGTGSGAAWTLVFPIGPR
jgi:hypothetical protein